MNDINVCFEKATKIVKEKIKNIENLVENMLPPGVSILAGKPKVGKTTFLLQLASAVSSKDSYFLGNKCSFTKVMYFSNETNKKRVQEILKNLDYSYENLFITFSNNVTITEIEETICTNRMKRKKENLLIILDTLQYIKYNKTIEFNDYQSTYEMMQQYLKISQKYNCSFILVHHTNKDTKKGQIFDNINGSVGIQGSAEHLMILDQDDEFSKDFQLHLMGRYILRQDINLQKDKNGCFEIQTTDKTLNCDNPDILTLINYVAKQEDKTITGTSNEICSNANLKTISANWLYKKLVEYQEFLKQCSITFEKRKSNGIRLIEIKCNDRELEEDESSQS